jgi:hypothetical protein
MDDGVAVPPGEATYDGKVYWITDGVYRYLAEKKRGSSTIELLVTEGTHEDARWQALAANQANGKELTRKEKREAVKRALRHPYSSKLSDRAIAAHLGVSYETVRRYREPLSQSDSGPQPRIDANGRTMNVKKIGKKKRGPASRRLAEPPAPPPPAPAGANAAPAGAASGGPVSPQAVPGSDRPPAVGTPDGGANRAAPEAAAAENRGPAAGADLGCPAPEQLAKVEQCDEILEEVEVRHPEVGQGLDPAQLERLRARLVSIRVRALRMWEALPAPA